MKQVKLLASSVVSNPSLIKVCEEQIALANAEMRKLTAAPMRGEKYNALQYEWWRSWGAAYLKIMNIVKLRGE